MSLSAINSSTTTTAYASYENAPLGDTTNQQATFQSSTDYRLLQTTNKPNIDTTVTGEDSGWYMHIKVNKIHIACIIIQ